MHYSVSGFSAFGTLQVLPWALLLPHNLALDPKNDGSTKAAAAVAEFAIKALTGVCRRPLEMWGAIEQLAAAHARPPAPGAREEPHPTPPAGQLLNDASTAALLPLFSMFRAALRRFRRTDSTSQCPEKPTVAPGADPREEEQQQDAMVWGYVAGAAWLILPQAKCSSIFAQGLLGLAVEELAALSGRPGAIGPRISWTSPRGSETGEGLTVTAGRGTPAVFLQLLEWLWMTAREGAAGGCSAPPASPEVAESKDGNAKAKKKRARQPGAPTPGSQSLLVLGHNTSSFAVETAHGDGGPACERLFAIGEMPQGHSAPGSHHSLSHDVLYLGSNPLRIEQAATADGPDMLCAERQRCRRHDELMRMLMLMDRACSGSGVTDTSTVTAEEGAHVVTAAAACAAALPDAHLKLLVGPCMGLLRRTLLQPSADDIAGTHGTAGPGTRPRKRGKKSSIVQSGVDDGAGGAASGGVGARACAAAIAAVVCVERQSRVWRELPGPGVASTGRTVSGAAWGIIRDISGHKVQAGECMTGGWNQVPFAAVVLCLQERQGVLPAGCSLAEVSTGVWGDQQQDALPDAVLLLADAAAQSSDTGSGISGEAHDRQPAAFARAVTAATAGYGAPISQLLAGAARSTLALLPGEVLHAALESMLNTAEDDLPDTQHNLHSARCVFALAEACAHPSITASSLHGASAQQLPLLLRRACRLALKCVAGPSGTAAQPAALAFLRSFFQGMAQQDTSQQPAAVQMVVKSPDDSLLEAAINSTSAVQEVLMPAACLRIAQSPQAALAAARLLQVHQTSSKQKPTASLSRIISRQSRALAAVLMAARDRQAPSGDLRQAAQDLAAAVRKPVLRLLAKPPPQVAGDLESRVDWVGVGQLALQCLQLQPLQV